jgi:hypothetical protein
LPHLQWRNVDLVGGEITVGKTKPIGRFIAAAFNGTRKPRQGRMKPSRKGTFTFALTQKVLKIFRLCDLQWESAYLLAKRIGSSGRTRTYNPSVNSRMLCH